VGEKTAAGLVARFGTIAGLLQALDAGQAVPKASTIAVHREYLLAATRVVPVRRDVPVPTGMRIDLPRTAAHPERLLDLVDEWGVAASANRLLAALAMAHAGSS
jgi:hypothetical protein